MHGTTNAITHIQLILGMIVPVTFVKYLLYWLDGALLHASFDTELVQKIGKMLKMSAEYNVTLHAEKYKPYAMSICWCERLISKEEVRLDPLRMKDLEKMERSSAASNLQQFLCRLQWLKSRNS